VVGDRLAQAVESLDGVELVVGFGVAIVALNDLAVLDDRPAGDEGEADATLAVGAEAADVGSDAAGQLSVPKRLMSEVMRPDRKTLFMGSLQILPASLSRRDELKRSPRLRGRRTGAKRRGTSIF